MAHDVEALLQELQQLKAELYFYKHHHRDCALKSQLSPPPNDECCDGLTIVPFNPASSKKQKTEADPRWTSTVAQLLQKVPDALTWIPAKKRLGLDNTSIICHIFGICQIPRADVDPLPHSHPLPTIDPVGLTDLATQFALLTKRSQYRANVSSLVRTYQECILVSLCVVLQYCEIDIGYINTVMRICISNSGDANLYTLRLSAVWLNKTIVELQGGNRWHGRAGEAFFLSGLSISKYARISMQKLSRQYIVDKLGHQKYFSEQLDALNDIPLSIPAFIKVILKDKLTLQQICTPLGYNSLEEIREICSRYTAILDTAVLPEHSTENENKKRKLADFQRAPLVWDPIQFAADLEWEKLYLKVIEEGARDGAEENDDDPYMGAMEGAEDVEILAV